MGEVMNTLRATRGDRYEAVYRRDQGDGLDKAVMRQVVENRGYMNVTGLRVISPGLVAIEGTVLEETDAGYLFGAWIDDDQGNVWRLEGWEQTGTRGGPLTFLDSTLFTFEEALQAGTTYLEQQRRRAREKLGEVAGEGIEEATRGTFEAVQAGADRAVQGALTPFLGEEASDRVAGVVLLALVIGAAILAVRRFA